MVLYRWANIALKSFWFDLHPLVAERQLVGWQRMVVNTLFLSQQRHFLADDCTRGRERAHIFTYIHFEYFTFYIYCLGDFVDLFCHLSGRAVSRPTLLVSNMTFIISGSEWKTCAWRSPFWVSALWLLFLQPLPTVYYFTSYRTIESTSGNKAVSCEKPAPLLTQPCTFSALKETAGSLLPDKLTPFLHLQQPC